MRIFKQETTLAGSFYNAFVYGAISFILVLVALFFLYVVCSKKYRLNWFEKDLLEKAKNGDFIGGQTGLSCALTKSETGSNRSLNEFSKEDKFWVPTSTGRKSVDHLDSPPTPVESRCNFSPDVASLDNGWESRNNPVPIARNQKHMILSTTNPARPRVTSMNTKLSHTKIDTSLYPKEPNMPPVEDALGSVHVSVSYDPAAGILSVRLIEARGLTPRDTTGTVDPYAKIRLLPDHYNVWQTRVDKKTLNPVFDEDFVFELKPSSVSFRTLEIVFYDFDAYSRHHCVGGVKLHLSELDLSEKQTFWRALERYVETDSDVELGNLMVSMTFLPNAERLTIVIVKARNLRMIDDSPKAMDTFIKVCLVQGEKRLKKRKTSVQRNTINPVFNEHLTFDVSKEILSKCSIEFWVYNENKLGSSEVIGKACVSLTSSSREDKQFFQEIFINKTAVIRWLKLKNPTTDNENVTTTFGIK